MPLPSVQDIVKLIKAGATIEAQEKIMELRQAVMDLQEENLRLRSEIQSIKTQAPEPVEYDAAAGVWWPKGKTNQGAPFCPRCNADKGRLVYMREIEMEPSCLADGYFAWHCVSCDLGITRKDKSGQPKVPLSASTGW